MVKDIYSKNMPHIGIKHYDVLILGAGPAGLTAALYASRYKLNVAVVGKSLGGTANLAEEVENWPGFVGSGKELMEKFKEQAASFGAKFLEVEVDSVVRDENGFVAEFQREGKPSVIHAKSLIIALGIERKKLDLKGEKEFLGKGVSYCATCDGLFFKGKTVSVVGGSDAAVKTAIYLSEIAKKVYIIYRKDELRAEPNLVDQIKEIRKIKVLYNSIITKIDGEKVVESVKVEEIDKKNPKKYSLDIDGIFIEIGGKPAREVISNLNLQTNGGHIKTSPKMETSLPGAFAAGDVTSGFLKQIVTAAGEGAIAAKSAYDYLRFEYGKS